MLIVENIFFVWFLQFTAGFILYREQICVFSGWLCKCCPLQLNEAHPAGGRQQLCCKVLCWFCWSYITDLKIRSWKVMSVMLLRSAVGKFLKLFNGSCFSTHKSYVKTLRVAFVIIPFVKGYENFSVFRMKCGWWLHTECGGSGKRLLRKQLVLFWSQ